jgi:D-lyxose ketol-isomerase
MRIEREKEMKRSERNAVIREARDAFARHGWALPPRPRWDVTDFGLGDFRKHGLTLVNLTEQPEYCEKLMFVREHQVTPRHFHKVKKEDIICRWGRLVIELGGEPGLIMEAQVNGEPCRIEANKPLTLEAGERITLTPGVPHSFWAGAPYAIVGEVSTANDDRQDNYFANSEVGRFTQIEEDEAALAKVVNDCP